MIKYIWILLAFLLGCSSSNDVAITQTGNPPKVSLGISIYNDTSFVTRLSARSSNDPHDTINAITITSAIMIVEEFEFTGISDTLEFDSDQPYVLDLALDSTTIVLDTIDAEDGQIFDSAILYLEDLDEEDNPELFDSLTEMQEYSMLIKGYVNGDSSKTFEFPFYDSEEIIVPLSKQIIVGKEGQQRITLILDVKMWFIDENGEFLNPFFLEDRDDIEESIFKSIHGEEDDDFEEENDEEEEHSF